MKFDIMERVKLLEALPPQGDLTTLKILRKLKESLSFSEAELKEFDTAHEYMCPHRDEMDGGQVIRCDNKGFFLEQPTCGKHDVTMLPTGEMNLTIPPDALGKKKEIHFGAQALIICCNTLKRMDSQKQLTEAHISLYEKFFPPEEEEDANKGKES